MSKSIRELALATIAELDRRGWTTGTLGRTHVWKWDDETQTESVTEVLEEDCEVCLVGAMSSAYNPYHPFFPGYGVDATGGTISGNYQLFADAVRAEVAKDMEVLAAMDPTAGDNFIIAHWNDSFSGGVDAVKALLQRVADNNKDAK